MSAPVFPPRIVPAGEAALLVELGTAIAPATTERVLRLAAAIQKAALPGIVDLVPGYVTLLVCFDPALADAAGLERHLRALATTASDVPLPPGKLVEIPVAYGGEYGPDLADVARHTGLSEAEVIARHAGAEYRVASLGFVPGFAYLVGLPPELATPRLPTPRTGTPAGSVGIGGVQTGVYPVDTPGGWRVIGRTPLRLFDPERDEPLILANGDRVRFTPVAATVFAGSTVLAREARPARSPDASPAGAGIRVLAPGMLTTVQDLGRPGRLHEGVNGEGALDRAALILGNRLVGNDPDAAGLEITLLGPHLRFERETVVALTGADLGATLGGIRLPLWTPVAVPAGGEIAFAPDRASGRGARAYLCVAGGIDLPPILGSRSTSLAVGIGGLAGRALRAGDLLPIGAATAPPATLLRRRLCAPPPHYDPEIVARVVPGPQRDRFTAEGIANLLRGPYRASTRSDRMGLRLKDGPPVTHARGADLISEALVPGSIQVPGDAQPIVLLRGCATAGGYPKVATVIDADLDRLGQARPGDVVTFQEVSADEGRAATLAYRSALGPSAVAILPKVSETDALSALTALTSALTATRFATLRVTIADGDRRLRVTWRR